MDWEKQTMHFSLLPRGPFCLIPACVPQLLTQPLLIRRELVDAAGTIYDVEAFVTLFQN